ncbi:MAG: amidase family protein, partial [Candidatus Rokuibacteriota bacterium]
MSDGATSALAIAAAVRAGTMRARDVVAAALDRIAARATLNAFTRVLGDAALADADAVDRRLATGGDPGPLAGVPFAVKNLFDIAGLPTLAGSKINAGLPPAARDATAVARLRAAGAVLVGALNMDEYAYGFSTENTHYGPTRNPHDPTRIAGGSSGGSAAAVAAGLVPLALGTDTNGSIRVPGALCGVFALKPTFGRVSRAGVVPLAWSFDHAGPFARHVADLAAAFDAIQGPDARDPVCVTRPPAPCTVELARGVEGLRIAVAGGHFARLADDAA